MVYFLIAERYSQTVGSANINGGKYNAGSNIKGAELRSTARRL